MNVYIGTLPEEVIEAIEEFFNQMNSKKHHD